MIAPKVEPLSELLKYKLLAVSVKSISINIHEEESDILLQVMSPYLQLPSIYAVHLGTVITLIWHSQSAMFPTSTQCNH